MRHVAGTDRLPDFLDRGEVGVGSLAGDDPFDDPIEPCATFATWHAFAARLVGVEPHQRQRCGRDVGGGVHHHHGPRPEHRPSGIRRRYPRTGCRADRRPPWSRTAAGHERLEFVAVADALAELVAVEQVAERCRAVDDLVHAGTLDVSRHSDHARPWRCLGSDRGERRRPVEGDERQVRERLDVVDDRRLAVQPDRRREVRRLEARHAALAFERLDQRRLLTHHVGAGTPVQARCRR